MTTPATVLLVDDEPRVLDALEALLAMEYRVLRADRPDQGLARLAEEDVAVVVSDQRMPGMTGTELLARSREVAPDTVRILLTAFTDVDAMMESINASGVYHFLLKPWDPNELLLLVTRAVEHHRLCREREALVKDLAAKNAALERALAHLEATQSDLVREAAVRTHLERYVSPRLVDLAIANPGILDLPGSWREATVLFADIRGFTRLIESTPAPVVIRLLNEYFTEMIAVIFRHQGTVEQLVGDEIVALFGVPEPGPDVALRAVRAAVDMVAAVQRLSAGWLAEGLPAFDIGVGISSGRVMAGTIGSERRRELIVVGRAVVAASRIQRMTRLFDAHIILGEETFRQVGDVVEYRELGTPRLKGIRQRQTLYEIRGLREPAAATAAG
ncbi:MAG TPA: adenylate/guanylate cyclase domain-containing protein [Methylomirabilota bacterium]|nr:adenylate/guanylate cyclase domain-containing protein [Methylomirabilota bacterium]